MVDVVRAVPTDAPGLSEIAWAAKAAWGYPVDQMRRWRQELVLSAVSIENCPTFLVRHDEPAGFYQLRSKVRAGYELAHLWVSPARMGRGIGQALVGHAMALLAASGIPDVDVDSDPNAEGFYLSLGARRLSVVRAPIPGDQARVRPQLVLSTRVRSA
ncbi:GNAT family N-acetyltransferase [Xanthomonas sp. NCPPB 2632]|uniref:GNAT family N-acetyltransferase n=1 Tax=Xanthomonas sp. NCPPB 2632 TaxID=3240912 RepID=UPI003518E2FB